MHYWLLFYELVEVGWGDRKLLGDKLSHPPYIA